MTSPNNTEPNQSAAGGEDTGKLQTTVIWEVHRLSEILAALSGQNTAEWLRDLVTECIIERIPPDTQKFYLGEAVKISKARNEWYPDQPRIIEKRSQPATNSTSAKHRRGRKPLRG